MNVGIIGAGPTGLTAGYELTRRGHRVSLFESEKRYARLMNTVQVGEKRLEMFYHHLFTSDTDILGLIKELDLSSELSWQSPHNSIYLNGTILPFSSPFHLFSLEALSPAERISLGIFLARACLTANWKKIEDLTAREWVVRLAGEGVYQKIWQPLLHSKFDRDADRISAVWLWSRIKLRSTTRKKSLRSEMLGYLNGTFMTIYQKMASTIRENSGVVECSWPVTKITPRADGTLDLSGNGCSKQFDAVIVTAPPSVMLEMGLDLPPWYRHKIESIKYKAHICMMLELTHPLSPYYWIAVAENHFPFIAVIEHTNLLPVDGYHCHLVYLSRYLDEESDLFSSSDQYLQDLFIAYLSKIFPQWDRATIRSVQVNRARNVQPVILKGYSRILLPLTTPVDNLYLAGMAQIYPEDRGQNYAVRMGKTVARLVDDRSVHYLRRQEP